MKSSLDHKPKLTIFTAPKPFLDSHVSIIQRNALLNWVNLGEVIKVVVVGDEPGIREICEEIGVEHISEVHCNEYGTPMLSSIFSLAHRANDAPLMAYCNADILFLSDLLDAVDGLLELCQPFLGVGQRWDLDIQKSVDFSSDWELDISRLIRSKGKKHEQSGSDYFIFSKQSFLNIPDFSVGRAGWDNWMIYKARWHHWPVIDLTNSLTAIHQNHDYSHLAGGRKHYFQPESTVNVKLGGGRRTIFTLIDTTHEFKNGSLQRKKLDRKSFFRRIETFPLVGLRSKFLGSLAFILLHPIKAFNEIKGWLTYKINVVLGKID